MEVTSSIINAFAIIAVALIGFGTVMYQVKKGRSENVKDHGMVMEKLDSVIEELQYLDEDIGVIDAKIEVHLSDGVAHPPKKKTGKKK